MIPFAVVHTMVEWLLAVDCSCLCSVVLLDLLLDGDIARQHCNMHLIQVVLACESTEGPLHCGGSAMMDGGHPSMVGIPR